nr:N-acetylmuramoyl-L-alanine amidase [Deltaproteobacteria bacterium]
MGNLCTKSAASAALCLALFGCTDDGALESGQDPASTPGLDDDFAAAARAHDVPVDLLEAISYVETRWQMVIGESEHEGRPAGAGLFALWGDNLAVGAASTGVSEETARMDVTANITAAAARLAGFAEAHGIAGDDLLAWHPVIADFSQSDDPDVRSAYASDVLDALATGASAVAEDGTVIAMFDAHPELGTTHSAQGRGATADYANAVWRASPNYSSRNGTAVSLVVIH